MSNLQPATNFRVQFKDSNLPNVDKLIITGLELPDASGFSVLSKLWNGTSEYLSDTHNLEIVGIFREKRVEEGYECTFSLKNNTRLSSNYEDFLREQIWQFGAILRNFLLSPEYAKYCEYLRKHTPKPIVCSEMLDEFLEKSHENIFV